MNAKARALGMNDTHYVEPTGLSSRNQSSARDLATLVKAAHGDPILRELTRPRPITRSPSATARCNSTTRTAWCKSPDWDIGLQKTGYISKRGAAW